MKTLKFRGLTGNDNWVYGYYFYDSVHDAHQIVGVNGVFYTVKPETVGQFTGLPDKNGKEIYYGDFLKTANGMIVEVKWEDKKGKWIVDYDIQKPYYSSLYRQKPEQRCLIIGNVFENPELLKYY